METDDCCGNVHIFSPLTTLKVTCLRDSTKCQVLITEFFGDGDFHTFMCSLLIRYHQWRGDMFLAVLVKKICFFHYKHTQWCIQQLQLSNNTMLCSMSLNVFASCTVVWPEYCFDCGSFWRVSRVLLFSIKWSCFDL